MVTVHLGCLTDYYIAIGVNYLGHSGFAKKSYFWCTAESKNFSQLPEANVECRHIFDQMQTVFTGEFDKTVVSGAGVSDFVHIDHALKAKSNIPAKGLTELDRLAYVVAQIDCDC